MGVGRSLALSYVHLENTRNYRPCGLHPSLARAWPDLPDPGQPRLLGLGCRFMGWWLGGLVGRWVDGSMG